MNAYAVPTTGNLIDLAAVVVQRSAEHRCIASEYAGRAGPPPPGVDALLSAALGAVLRALEAMAAVPARTPAGIAAKATALREMFVAGCVEGDCGLAWSLVEDVIHVFG